MDAYRVIVHPLNTETAMKKIEEDNTLVFIVDIKSNKRQIKQAVKTLYDVQAEKINTLIRWVPQDADAFSETSFPLPFSKEVVRLDRCIQSEMARISFDPFDTGYTVRRGSRACCFARNLPSTAGSTDEMRAVTAVPPSCPPPFIPLR